MKSRATTDGRAHAFPEEAGPERRAAKPVGVAKCATVAVAGQGHVPHTATADRIRERAYALWEAADRPLGDGVEFWLAAETELSAGGL